MPYDPAQGVLAIGYSLRADAEVTIRLYDVLGYRVRILRFGAGDAGGRAGNNAASWDGRDERRALVESGVYWLVVSPTGEPDRRMRIAVTR